MPATVQRPGTNHPVGRRGPRRLSRGQATVELVLVLPVVVLALLLIIQVGLVARSQVLLVAAAREGARAGAAGGPDAAPDAVRAATGLDRSRLDVETSTQSGPGTIGQLLRVEVTYRAPTEVPIIGSLLGDPTLSAQVTMRLEDQAP